MNNESKTTPNVFTARHSELIKYVERQIRRQEGIRNGSMEDLTSNFNNNFEWNAEAVYKANLKIAFFRNLLATISSEECTEEYAKFVLRHEAEHAADDIMRSDPYNNHSSNGATNLARRWKFENFKDIHHIALNLLDRLDPDEA